MTPSPTQSAVYAAVHVFAPAVPSKEYFETRMADIKLLRDSSGLAVKKHKKNNTLVSVIKGNFKEVVEEAQSVRMGERPLPL